MKIRLSIIIYILFAILYLIYGRGCTPVVSSIYKVLPLVTLFTFILLSMKGTNDRKGLLICLCALLFSMIGDTAGEFKETSSGDLPLVLQISAFAIAHLTYIYSFVRHFGKVTEHKEKLAKSALCAVIIAYGIAASRIIVANIDNPTLHTAASIYLVIITIMALASVIQHREHQWFYIVGAFLFLISDSILAWRIFRGSFPGAGNYVMITYYAAQIMLNIRLDENT